MAKANRTGAARDAAPGMVQIEVLSPIDYNGERSSDGTLEVEKPTADELVRIGAARLLDAPALSQDGT